MRTDIWTDSKRSNAYKERSDAYQEGSDVFNTQLLFNESFRIPQIFNV